MSQMWALVSQDPKLDKVNENWTKWTKIGQSERKFNKVNEVKNVGWKHWQNSCSGNLRKYAKNAKWSQKCDILRQSVKSAGWLRLKTKSAIPHLPHLNRVPDYYTYHIWNYLTWDFHVDILKNVGVDPESIFSGIISIYLPLRRELLYMGPGRPRWADLKLL